MTSEGGYEEIGKSFSDDGKPRGSDIHRINVLKASSWNPVLPVNAGIHRKPSSIRSKFRGTEHSFLRRIKEGNSFLYDFFPSEECFDRELRDYPTPIQERIKDAKNQLALFEKYGTVSSYEWTLNNFGEMHP